MQKFTPITIPNNIFVIGGGGTGGRLIPMLTQFIKTITRGKSPTGWVENPAIWLIDDDVVESKNLLRQNFISNDVGKQKAVVLAERYSRAYDVNIYPITRRIQSENANAFYADVKAILDATAVAGLREAKTLEATFTNSIIVMCVDTAKARRDILNVFINKSSRQLRENMFFIDAGNEDSFGQVSFFHPVIMHSAEVYDSVAADKKIPRPNFSSVKLDFIPMDFAYYRDLVDTESTASCADLNQTLAINAIMATTIMGIIQNYYYRKEFTYNCLRISLDGGNSTQHNTFDDYRRKSVSAETFSLIYRGDNIKVKEKDGSASYMTFARNCNMGEFMLLVYNPLQAEIAREKALAERKRREEEAARLAAEYKAKREAAIAAGLPLPEEPTPPGILKVTIKRKEPEVPVAVAPPAPVAAQIIAPAVPTMQVLVEGTDIREAIPVETTGTTRRRRATTAATVPRATTAGAIPAPTAWAENTATT